MLPTRKVTSVTILAAYISISIIPLDLGLIEGYGKESSIEEESKKTTTFESQIRNLYENFLPCLRFDPYLHWRSCL